MELILTSEQAMLREMAARFADQAVKQTRALRDHDPSFSPERLRQAAEMGWFRILVPEEFGGLDLSLTDLILVLEELGRGLAAEPIAAAAVSAFALSRGLRSKQAAQLLEKLLVGGALVVPALQESCLGLLKGLPTTFLERQGSALLVTGRKHFVASEGATGFIVSAHGADGVSLCYLDALGTGCRQERHRTIEGRTVATLHIESSPVMLIGDGERASWQHRAIEDLALMASSAELLGVMEKAQEITLDYIRARNQFGKPID